MISLRSAAGCATLALGAWLAASTGFAEEAAVPDGATLYRERTCIACHGPDAKTPILPEYPKLAGQNEAYLLIQMRDIKSGARANGSTPAMRGVMHLVTDEELVVIAAYLATLER
jgi:cytochrome c